MGQINLSISHFDSYCSAHSFTLTFSNLYKKENMDGWWKEQQFSRLVYNSYWLCDWAAFWRISFDWLTWSNFYWLVLQLIKLTRIIQVKQVFTLTYILGQPKNYLEDGPDVIAVVSDYPEVVQDCPRHHLSEIINRWWSLLHLSQFVVAKYCSLQSGVSTEQDMRYWQI